MLKIQSLLSPEARRERERAFTLVELLIVVGIVAVLAIIAIPVYLGFQQQARNNALKQDVSNTVHSVAVAALKANGAEGTDGFVAYPNGSANPATGNQIGIPYSVANTNTRIMITDPVPSGTNPVSGSVNGKYVKQTNGSAKTGYEITGYYTDNSFYYTYNSSTGKFETGDNPYYTEYSPSWTGSSTGSSLPNAIVNTNYSFTFTTKASPDATYTGTNIPDGLTLSSDGKLTGQPTSGGSKVLTVTAQNSSGNITGTFSLLVQVPPTITTTSLPAGDKDSAYTTTITATGIAAPTFSATGLPTGLSIDPTSGVISGTPSVRGTYTPTVTATNGAGSTSQAYGLVIKDKPTIDASNNLGTITVGQTYTYTVTATGQPAPTFTATGLPTGLAIDQNTGTISGKILASDPTYGTGGTYSIKVTATNPSGSDNKTFTGAIVAAPAFTTTSLPSGTQNRAYSTTVTATGTPTPTYSASGLPTGLSINGNTGTISGTPTVAGNYTVTVTATNSVNTISQAYGLVLAYDTPAVPATPSQINASTYNSSFNGYPAFDTSSGSTVASWSTVTCNNNGTPEYYLREFYHNGTYYANGYNNSGWISGTSLDISSWLDSTNGQGATEDFGVTAHCYNSTGTSDWNGWTDFSGSRFGNQTSVVIAVYAPTANVAMANDGSNYIWWNGTTCANNTTPYYSVWQDYIDGSWGTNYPINNTTGLNGNVYGSGAGAYEHVILISYCSRNGKNSSSSTIGSEGWNHYGVYATGSNITNPADTKTYFTSYVYYNATPNLSSCAVYNAGNAVSSGISGNTCVFWGYIRNDGSYSPTVRGYISNGQYADYGYSTGMVQNYYQAYHYGDGTGWQTGGTNLNYSGQITFVSSPSYNGGSLKWVTAANSTYGISNSCPSGYYGWCGYENYYVTNGQPYTGYNVSVAFYATTGTGSTAGSTGCGSTYSSSNKKAYISCFFLGTNSDGWTTVKQNSAAGTWYVLTSHLTTDGNGNATVVMGADNMSTTGEHEWEVSNLSITR